jgi:Secretion system C-terminal sorting domain
MHLHHKIAAVAVAVFALSVGAAVIPSGLPAGYAGKVFTGDTLKGNAQQIPGVIKVVFFDEGGEGVGFHEMDGNGVGGGGTIRPLAADRSVEMQAFDSYWDWTVLNTPETLGSWHESWINSDPVNGDWTKHTVKVLTAGTYTIDVHAAAVDSLNSISLTFNNAAPIFINNLPHVLNSQIHQGSEVWHIWNRFNDVATVDLDTGLYTLKQQFVQGGWNFDKIIFRLKTSVGTKQPAFGNAAAGSLGLKTIISSNEMKVSYNRAGVGEAKISLVNCAGKTVLSSIEQSGTQGMQSQTINLRNMNRGVYFVQVEQNGCMEVKSITITH